MTMVTESCSSISLVVSRKCVQVIYHIIQCKFTVAYSINIRLGDDDGGDAYQFNV